MHELSIADAIASIAARHADGRTVMRVEVRIGHLRQVVPSSLEFAWELITQDTALDGARLAIEYVPATARCGACGSLDVNVTGGDELLVDALQLEEEPELTRSGG